MSSDNLVPASHSRAGTGAVASQDGLGPPPSPRPAEIAVVAGDNLTPAHAEFANFHEGYVRHYIALADSKATLALGVTAGLLTYLFSQPKFHDLIVSPVWKALFVQALISSTFLALSTACAALVIAPRLSSTGEEIVFFGSVAKYASSDSYVKQIARRNDAELTAARIQHCYEISNVCVRKYDMLRRAIWFGCLGVASLLPILSSI
jgi:Family of unknown function (DUF5706)